MVDGVRIVGRHLDGHHPLEAEGQLCGVHAVEVHHADVILLLLPGHVTVASEPALAVAVHDVRVAGLGHGGPRLAAADVPPERRVSAGRSVLRRVAGHHDGGVVLLTGVQPVREAVVDIHLIQLGGGQVVLGGPRLSAIQRHVGAAVVGLHPDVRVVGVDPDVVVVAMGRGHPRPGLTRIIGDVEALVVDEDLVGVRGIGIHVCVVEGPIHDAPLVAHHAPRLATVVRAVQALVGIGGLDQRVHPVRVVGRNRQVHLPDEARRHALGHDVPRVAPIGGLPEAVLLTGRLHARDDGPGLALTPPHGRVDLVGLRGVEL